MVTKTAKKTRKLPTSKECAEALGKQRVIEIYRSIGVRADGGSFMENNSGWVSVHSLFREDVNASAAFSPSTGNYSDFGDDSLDEFKSLGQVLFEKDPKFSSHFEAMEWLRSEAGLTSSTGKNSGKTAKRKTRAKPDKAREKTIDDSEQLPLKESLLKIGAYDYITREKYLYNSLRRWCDDHSPILPEILVDEFQVGYKYEKVRYKNSDGEDQWSRGVPCLWVPVYWFHDLNLQIGIKLFAMPLAPQHKKVIPAVVNRTVLKAVKTKLKLFKWAKGRQGIVIPESDRKRLLAGDTEGWSTLAVEGETDCFSAASVRPPESKIILFTNVDGAKEDFPGDWKNTFPTSFVYCLGDNDKPGQAGAKNKAQKPSLPGQKTMLVKLEGEIEEKHGRDLKDALAECVGDPDRGWSRVVEKMIYESKLVETEELTQGDEPQFTLQPEEESESDLDIANKFAESCQVGDVCPYYIIRERIYHWDGERYSEIPPKRLRNHLWKWLNENDYHPTQRKVSSVLDALEAVITTNNHSMTASLPHWRQEPLGDYPIDCDLRCCIPTQSEIIVPNDSLLPSEWERYPRSAALFTRDSHPWDYGIDRNGRIDWDLPEAFHQFLMQIFDGEESQINALQLCLGYWMSGQTNQQRIGFLVGPPRSGKGLLTRLCKKIIGESQVIGSGFFNLANNFGLSQFVNAKLAILSDERKVTKQVVEQVLPILLKISGEDDIPINEKYRAEYTAKVNARLLIVSNQLNLISDECQALSSRLVLLKTRRSFAGSEDVNLERKIFEELPGIVMWGAAGLARVLNGERLKSPEDTRDELEDMTDNDNPLNPFFRYLVADDPTTIPASERHCTDRAELLELARAWASAKGIEAFKTLSPRRLREALENRFHHVKPYQYRVKCHDKCDLEVGTRQWTFQGIRVDTEKIDFSPYPPVTTYNRKL